MIAHFLMLSSCTFFSRFNSVFSISKSAAEQINRMLKNDFENRFMKIDLIPGGCAGFRYDFDFLPKPRPGDKVFEKDGAKVVLSEKTLLYLRGGTLDFISDKFSQTFHVKLPVESESHNCTCGRSVGTDTGNSCQ